MAKLKLCNKCKEWKSITLFTRQGYTCHDCQRKRGMNRKSVPCSDCRLIGTSHVSGICGTCRSLARNRGIHA